MNNIKLTIEIEQPVQIVWDTFHDRSLMNKWMIGFDSMQLIEGKENQVGSKYKLYFDENGKTIEMEETITAFDEPSYFANTMKTEMMETKTTMKFLPTATGTKIEVESVFEAEGMVANLMIRMGLSFIENRYKQSYHKFKELVEEL